MLILAVTKAASIADKIRGIPMDFWLKVGLGIVAIVLTVKILSKIAHMDKAVVTVVAGIVVSVLGFTWIYERNEPRWASPMIDVVAGFFPTKGKIEQRNRSSDGH